MSFVSATAQPGRRQEIICETQSGVDRPSILLQQSTVQASDQWYSSGSVQTSVLYIPSYVRTSYVLDKTYPVRRYPPPLPAALRPAVKLDLCDVAGWLDNIDRRTTQTAISTRLGRRLSTTTVLESICVTSSTQLPYKNEQISRYK